MILGLGLGFLGEKKTNCRGGDTHMRLMRDIMIFKFFSRFQDKDPLVIHKLNKLRYHLPLMLFHLKIRSIK